MAIPPQINSAADPFNAARTALASSHPPKNLMSVFVSERSTAGFKRLDKTTQKSNSGAEPKLSKTEVVDKKETDEGFESELLLFAILGNPSTKSRYRGATEVMIRREHNRNTICLDATRLGDVQTF